MKQSLKPENKKSVIIYTQYYPPEVGAPQARLSDLATFFNQNNFKVTILTAFPNYPTGKVAGGYKGLFMKETDGEIIIYRTWIHPSLSVAIFPRLFSYFSFILSSFLVGFFLPKADLIFTESPPLFLGLSGYALSRLKRAKWIFNVSDLWPESVVELGIIDKKSLNYMISSAIESFCYRKAWLVTGQSKTILSNINQRFPNVETYHLSNGVNPDLYTSKCNELSNNKINIVYAGLHGIAQGLEQIVLAARELDQYPNIQFSLVGDGPEKETILAKANKYHLKNIHFFPPVRSTEIPGLLEEADILLIPLKSQLTGAVPSKLYEAMAAAKPLILIAGSEAADIVLDTNCGIVVAPGNISDLCEAIKLLAANPELRKEMGANGRKAAISQYNRKHIYQKFGDFLLPKFSGKIR